MKTHYVFANKVKELPEVLIYNKPRTALYNMMTTKNPRVVGFMWALPGEYKGERSFEIPLFAINKKDRRQGYGKQLMDFAKARSYQKGCEGRIFLTSDINTMESKIPPHIFYRKQGFTSDDKEFLKKVDSFIKEGKEMTFRDSKTMIMYYDPNKKSILEKIKTILNKI